MGNILVSTGKMPYIGHAVKMSMNKAKKGTLMAETTTQRQARIEIRIDPSSKELVEKAASILGQSLSSFIVSRMVADAQQVIDANARTMLSLQDWERFHAVLSNPPAPNNALKKAARRYKDSITQSDGL
jgi:uncharacterized protein (DUF1778 family)